MNTRVLYLSRNYPNNIFRTNGLWVEGLVRAMSARCDVRVAAPVPYFPPLLESSGYARYRRILANECVNGVEVYRPRFLSPPGYWLHSHIGELIYRSIVGKMDRFRKHFPFDLVHAQFSYPEGHVGARLARRYSVPLVITEHAAWIPWMDDYPRVRRQAVAATRLSSAVIAGSRYLRDTILHFSVEPEKLRLIPIGIDSRLFRLPEATAHRDPRRILFVGRIHATKGVDILFRALRILLRQHPDITLTLVGGDLGFRNFQLQEQGMRRLATELGINGHLEFAGSQPPARVAGYMQGSAMLVLPSRRESFGAVLVEALACGIPVVATRCGGPEDFVNDAVGVLVEKENPEALAAGMASVLSRLDAYPAAALSRYAHAGYSWEGVAEKTWQVYRQALGEAG